MKRGFALELMVGLLFWTGLGQVLAEESGSVLAQLRAQGQDPVTLAMRTDSPSAGVRSGKLKAVIDLEDQEMKVFIDGRHQYTWKVSTGRSGYITPNGTYKPQWLARMHYSRKYDDAPMPYSVFFHGGYAVHGTTSISRLGRPASHGCVRLHPDNAKTFFNLVKEHGKARSTIQIVGTSPVPKANSRGTSSRDTATRAQRASSSTATASSRQGSANDCLGCSSMANFGRVPSIH